MRQLFFDVAGQPMKAAAFRKRYPQRLHIVTTRLLGLVLCTEFVGINHNSERGRIKIYETTIHTTALGVLVRSSWSSSLLWARATHLAIMVRALLGGALWWRFRAVRAVEAARALRSGEGE
jgi:hypothetical protein